MSSWLSPFFGGRQTVAPTTKDNNSLDAPPSFPLPGSIQRSQIPTFNVEPPDDNQDDDEGEDTPTEETAKAPNKKKKPRVKVALKPGRSQLDWAKLKSSGTDLSGVSGPQRITPSMLKQHNKKEDAWSAFNGKVYNITPYLEYHPGGERELMRAAGRDGTKLFYNTHAWVNLEFTLETCLVGYLVSE